MSRVIPPPKIIAINTLPSSAINIAIEEIFMLIKNEKNLSFRTKKELLKLAQKGNIICLFVGDNLAGFLMLNSLSKQLLELHGLFIKKACRGNNYSTLLLNNVTSNTQYSYLGATFLEDIEKKLIEHGFKKIRFRQLTFWEALNFLRHRCYLHRIKEVLRHKKKSNLVFMKKECY